MAAASIRDLKGETKMGDTAAGQSGETGVPDNLNQPPAAAAGQGEESPAESQSVLDELAKMGAELDGELTDMSVRGEGGEAGEAAGGGEPAAAEGSGTPEAPWAEKLKELGQEHSFSSDADLAAAYAEMRTKLSQRDQMAKLGEMMLPHMDKLSQVMSSQEQQKGPEPVWNPPPLPVGAAEELAKPEDQRDPQVMAAVNAHRRYAEAKWQKWTSDPGSFVQDLVIPAVKQEIQASMQGATTEARHKQIIAANRDFLSDQKNMSVVLGMVQDEMVPLERAIQLAKYMTGVSKVEAAAARQNDVKVPTAGAVAASGVAPTSTPRKADPSDPVALAMEVARQMGVKL